MGRSSPGNMAKSACSSKRLSMASIRSFGCLNGVGAQFATKLTGGSVGISSSPPGSVTIRVSTLMCSLSLGSGSCTQFSCHSWPHHWLLHPPGMCWPGLARRGWGCSPPQVSCIIMWCCHASASVSQYLFGVCNL